MAPNDLITSGLLYEGSDFTAWKTKVEAVVRNRNLRDTIVSKRHIGAAVHRQLMKAEAAIIHNCVSKAFLDRVPASVMHDARDLLKYLAKLATPFPLLDLPAEMREIIYRFALPPEFTFKTRSIRAPGFKAQIPGLLHASSQLRNETLPLFYAIPFTFYTDWVTLLDWSPDFESPDEGILQDRLKKLFSITGYAVGTFVSLPVPSWKYSDYGWTTKMLRA